MKRGWMRQMATRKRGVAAVEYILIVALVAIAVAGVFVVFPDALAAYYSHVTGLICQA